MSAIQMAPNASGTGTLSIASPNTISNRTLTLPDQTGTLVSTSGVNAVGQIPFSTDGSTYTATAKIVSGTAVASTSGTSIDFTSIPSWVKRITVMFQGVSTNGLSNYIIQLGTGSTTYTTSGYLGTSTVSSSGGNNAANMSTGFLLNQSSQGATCVFHGLITVALLGSNNWVASGYCGESDAARGWTTGGSVALGATLTAVRITTVNGTDTFDAGSINLLWE